jgi:hypothetical protein
MSQVSPMATPQACLRRICDVASFFSAPAFFC